ncbi:T9SS type A sorting domain-containing protein [Hymenobacter actinosclerus]|uniref:Por secretion system C-terminal sorting domain-containing protein n=1 Tax=Hymenobacter actinosclerus TaxID=82805 RepID=A0A1I0I8A8_9BACT|nr:T9SS type A sorting domain-containing protein [Hymenobacter actinosclerus]SET92077.1 Por secretion system C-terminal sorting domain-containing protein [Hymenobacter actinosclerus]
MKKNYLLFVGLLLGLVPAARAQYEFKDAADASSNGLGPYEQSFNTLSGTVPFTNNTTIPGVYAQAFVNGAPYQPLGLLANDGSNSGEGYYHFGTVGSSDRSFGGIAALSTGTGIGYVGIRFKNSSGKPIKNLEVQYAMEQWYNSGRQDAASVSVSYQMGGTVADLLTGTWTDVPELKVDAPSTATVIASRDGNSPSNRRVRQTTIENINLAAGQEVMIRWGYALNTNTNGNGLSIDDVVVTPQTNVFYSKATGQLNVLGSWGQSIDGTGVSPTSFTADNTTYYVQGAEADRISTTWTVSGANSKIVVGTATTPATLRIEYNKNISGRIDVSNNSVLLNRHTPTATYGPVGFTFGALGRTSTVEYNSNDTEHLILPAQYGNLKVSGAGGKRLASTVIVNGNLDLSSSARLVLDNYSLTINKGGSLLNSSPTAYVVTNGKGTLRQTVANSGTDVLFPVGSSATSYTPAALQQPNSTTARNEDVYGVRVIDNVYTTYDNAGTGTTVINKESVKKTWLVDEEVSGNSDVTMTLQWNAADETPAPNAFDRTKAYISHYSAGTFDKPASSAATTGTTPNAYKLTQTGITSFSPFVVSSRPRGVLPVTLLSFGARRAQQAVLCEWRTAQELNNDYFIVERSLSGTGFVAVGTVTGRGTTTTEQQYRFVDQQAPTGLVYYRLRQVDTDGTETYSAVVTISANATAADYLVTVTPNPGTGLYQLVAPATGRPAEIFNVLGSQVQTVAADGRINLQAQPAGVYLLRLYLPEGPRSIRIIKE